MRVLSDQDIIGGAWLVFEASARPGQVEAAEFMRSWSSLGLKVSRVRPWRRPELLPACRNYMWGFSLDSKVVRHAQLLGTICGELDCPKAGCMERGKPDLSHRNAQ